MKTCACGCGEPLTQRRANARYATDACRARTWKQETGYALPATRKRDQNAKKKRTRRVDVRISYGKAVLAIEHALTGLIADDLRRHRARQAAATVLADRQKEALHG